jgi:hypothetical protein
MKPTCYSAACTDSGFLLGCGHEHETIGDAATCIKCAGGYVVGVENGVMRSLSPKEESEFQSIIRDSSKYPAPHIPAPASEKPSRDQGYAVMTRIRMVDHWKWTTWMCFDTYAQAVACARKGDRVVRFESEAWAGLKQQQWAEQPATASPVHAKERETLPSRTEGEPLVEFVLRLLNALDPAGLLPMERQEDNRLTSESDKQTSKIETPTYIARLILSRLSESEIGKLDRILDEDFPALLDAIRRRSQTVANNNSGCY